MIKRYTTFIILLVSTIFILVGCSSENPKETSTTEASTTEVTTEAATEAPTETVRPTEASTSEEFVFSGGIDTNGFWEGILAQDYVDPIEYTAIKIPSDVHVISDENLQVEIDNLLVNFISENQITDRAIVDGDTVNIDYIGSVDGVEFEGGNTGGAGTDVTIGVTSYIDDFLEQLIGHTPSESFDIEVTFPDDYGVDTLNGKDAVFAITINYIAEEVSPELTDDFVSQNLTEQYGWTSVNNLKTEIKEELKESAIYQYITQYLEENSTILSLPEELIKYQEGSVTDYYEKSAAYYSMEVDEFLATYVGYSSMSEVIASHNEDINNTVGFYLIIQAIAEDLSMTVTDEDLTNFSTKQMGTADYSELEAYYGLPYVKMVTLHDKVIQHLIENAVLE